MRSACVSALIYSWAESSNDSNKVSLAIQEAAAKEFGIKEAAGWKVPAAVKTEFDKNGAVYRDFLRSQYQATQQSLKDAGIKPDDKVLLTRGTSQDLGGAKKGDEIQVQLRPLSSFTTNSATSALFAETSAASYATTGYQIQASVQAKDILSTPATGAGCFTEKEVVILGGVTNAIVKNTYAF